MTADFSKIMDSYKDHFTPSSDQVTSPAGLKRKRDDNMNRNVADGNPLLKLLVPDFVAGVLIGKGGSNLKLLEQTYGAKLRISPSGKYYPGTSERILIISGEVNQISELNRHITEKAVPMDRRNPSADQTQLADSVVVKIVVPNITAGIILGKAGTIIKQIQEETQARISMNKMGESSVHNERVITISGTQQQKEEACKQVIAKVSVDDNNMQMNGNLTYNGLDGGGGGGGNNERSGGSGGGFNDRSSMDRSMPMSSATTSNTPNGGGSGGVDMSALFSGSQQNPLQSMFAAAAQQQNAASQQQQMASALSSAYGSMQQSSGMQSVGQMQPPTSSRKIKTTVTINMQVPEMLVSMLLSGGSMSGSLFNEFVQFSGAQIQMSEYVLPGTTDRQLAIRGLLNQVQIAYFLVNQKLQQAEQDLASNPTYQQYSAQMYK